jgi:hypothetical protein
VEGSSKRSTRRHLAQASPDAAKAVQTSPVGQTLQRTIPNSADGRCGQMSVLLPHQVGAKSRTR